MGGRSRGWARFTARVCVACTFLAVAATFSLIWLMRGLSRRLPKIRTKGSPSPSPMRHPPSCYPTGPTLHFEPRGTVTPPSNGRTTLSLPSPLALSRLRVLHVARLRRQPPIVIGSAGGGRELVDLRPAPVGVLEQVCRAYQEVSSPPRSGSTGRPGVDTGRPGVGGRSEGRLRRDRRGLEGAGGLCERRRRSQSQHLKRICASRGRTSPRPPPRSFSDRRAAVRVARWLCLNPQGEADRPRIPRPTRCRSKSSARKRLAQRGLAKNSPTRSPPHIARRRQAARRRRAAALAALAPVALQARPSPDPRRRAAPDREGRPIEARPPPGRSRENTTQRPGSTSAPASSSSWQKHSSRFTRSIDRRSPRCELSPACAPGRPGGASPLESGWCPCWCRSP